MTEMRRIIIVGTTGSGKTTLAFNLAAKLDYPAIDLDDLHWQPGWIENDLQTFQAKIDSALNRDTWVLAGNYPSVNDRIWPKADTLIWLDYSFARTFNQLTRRSLSRVANKTTACNGNTETLGRLFSKDSILLWLFKSYASNKKTYDNVFSHPEQNPSIKNFISLESPAHTARFLAQVK
jgi:adenylate kinase family enzyme